jgi:hypothetical protein
MSAADNTRVMNRAERSAPDDYVRLSAHPRAKRSIARTKAIGGLAGFVIGFWLASKAGLPSWDVGARALAGGIGGYVLLWLFAVTFWRQYALAEFRAAEVRRARRVTEYYARMEQLRAEKEAALKSASDAIA